MDPKPFDQGVAAATEPTSATRTARLGARPRYAKASQGWFSKAGRIVALEVTILEKSHGFFRAQQHVHVGRENETPQFDR
jgi:hypothetical protein